MKDEEFAFKGLAGVVEEGAAAAVAAGVNEGALGLNGFAFGLNAGAFVLSFEVVAGVVDEVEAAVDGALVEAVEESVLDMMNRGVIGVWNYGRYYALTNANSPAAFTLSGEDDGGRSAQWSRNLGLIEGK